MYLKKLVLTFVVFFVVTVSCVADNWVTVNIFPSARIDFPDKPEPMHLSQFKMLEAKNITGVYMAGTNNNYQALSNVGAGELENFYNTFIESSSDNSDATQVYIRKDFSYRGLKGKEFEYTKKGEINPLIKIRGRERVLFVKGYLYCYSFTTADSMTNFEEHCNRFFGSFYIPGEGPLMQFDPKTTLIAKLSKMAGHLFAYSLLSLLIGLPVYFIIKLERRQKEKITAADEITTPEQSDL